MEILEQLCSIMKAVEQKYVIIQMMHGKALDRLPLSWREVGKALMNSQTYLQYYNSSYSMIF